MGKYQKAVIQSNGVWRIYEQMGVFTIYHEFWWDGKKHKHIDGAGNRYTSLSEALAKVAEYIKHYEVHTCCTPYGANTDK